MRTKILFCFIIFCGVIFAFSCKPNCDPKIPKDVKAIDWENYNDVYTVNWNYVRKCMEPNSDIGKYIKVYGWIVGDYPLIDPFFLVSNGEKTMIYVKFSYEVDYDELINSLKMKFAANDITKKCYVTGKLSLEELPDNVCCRTMPIIIINSADDIYFEEE